MSDKPTIRREAKLLRAKAAQFAHPEDFANASCHFFGGPLANWHGAQKPVVAGYWPQGSEFDCRPLMGYLHEAGYRVALPVCAPKPQAQRPLSLMGEGQGEGKSDAVTLAADPHPPGLQPVDLSHEGEGTRVLDFRLWSPGMTLEPDAMNMPSPPVSAETVIPDILIVPLLAFTRRGDRIGYGGGFYDATIRQLRENGGVIAVGLAYAVQEVDELQVEPHDQPLDWIVTESYARRAER